MEFPQREKQYNYKKLTKKVRKFSLKGKAEAELRLRTQKYFFSTEFLRIYSVCVKNTTYIVSTKLSILYIVVWLTDVRNIDIISMN